MNKIILILILMSLIIPNTSAFPFNYEVISTKEIEFNNFQTIIKMNGNPNPSAVLTAINAEKSNNIYLQNVIKNGDYYYILGKLKQYNNKSNKLFNPWWSPTWKNYTELRINNTINNSELTDVVLNGYIPFSPGMNVNFTDIRIVNSSDESLQSYWIENYSTNNYVKIFINISHLNAGWNNNTYRIYFNSSTASNVSTTDIFSGIIGNGSLIASYHMDECSGSIAKDTYLLKNGTITNPVWSTTSKKYGACALDMQGNARVNIGNVGWNFSTGDFTLETWEYWDGTTADYQNWFRRGDSEGILARIAYGSPPVYQVFVGGTFVVNGGSVGSNSWHHILISRKNGYTTLWVDGTNYSSKASTGSIPASVTMYLGASATGEYFDGKMDEVKIYSYGINQSEASNLYEHYGYTTLNYSGYNLLYKYINGTPNFIVGDSDNYKQIIISSWRNNYTNNEQTSFDVYGDNYINFNISTNLAVDRYDWYYDGEGMLFSQNNYTFLVNKSMLIQAYAVNYSYTNEASKVWTITYYEPIPTSTPEADEIYFTDENKLIKPNSFIVILNNDITSNIIKNNSILVIATKNDIYGVNSSSGSIKYKFHTLLPTLSMYEKNNFIYVLNKNEIIKLYMENGSMIYKYKISNISKIV